MKVTLTINVDLFEYNRFFKVKEVDGELIAIYDLIQIHSDRKIEKGEPEDIQIYFEEESA
tara:strand:+ start:325 stop:504 length:180 start_codon:yes stop_codon:yes gene_type:complete